MTEEADPTRRNRLDEAESPYLQQHADNPVNWQPWDEQALAAARERDVPIFLSIGYSACHWCHVMEEESFQDESVAETLNGSFVPIKVDREERPDLDSIYMSICQQVTGRGGWPLNVWLTPEGKPFYVGTYFPKEPRRGAPGFEQLLADIVDSWTDPEEREDVEQRAEQWTRAIRGTLEETPDHPDAEVDDDLLETAASAALRGADRDHGGWGGGPKFPHPGRLHVLARTYAESGRDAAVEVIRETLDAMADGGMYDQLGGGFHRYATDQEWVVPHFEKMLYDNAELPRAYLAGYQLTGEQRYRDVATETLAFVESELQHPDGGFYSTLDAQSRPPGADPDDSEEEEGAFYVWTPAQVREAVDSADIEDSDLAVELFRERFGVTQSGNFEGKTVLTRQRSVADLAEGHDLAPERVRDLLSAAESAALSARKNRPRPRRDEKVLAGWNGLAISAFAEASLVADESWIDPAVEALDFLRERLWDADAGRLHRRYRDGDAGIEGYLEDYAFLGRGALDCYQATGDVDHLAFALDLARAIESEFWDSEAQTLYFTPQSGETLVARPQELTDQSTPSSAGVAAELLLALSQFVTHDRFETVARGVLDTNSGTLAADPLQHASLVLAADADAHGFSELTVVPAELPAKWRETLAETYLPRRLLAPRPEGDISAWLDALDLAETPPIWVGRDARDGGPTVYACRERACSPPREDLAAALEWFESGPN